MTIPGTVIYIGNSAFQYCPALTSVDIPDSVTFIGHAAFYASPLLSSVTIPGSVTYVGTLAFSGTAISYMNIPDSVTYLGTYAFHNCQALTQVDIGRGITTIQDYSFYLCNSLASLTIPSSVTSIGIDAFASCQMTSVTIPSSVTSIGFGAFAICPSLTSVNIGSGVTNIGDAAFTGCPALNSITFQGLVAPTTVGAGWIDGTPGEIRGHADAASNFPAPGEVWNGLMMGEYVPGDYTYTISEGVATITGYTGAGGAITIPSRLAGCPVVVIGTTAFASCASLIYVIIPNTVTTIGVYAFAACTSLTSVTIGSGVTSIGEMSFYDCISLASVTFPDSVTTIGNNAFQSCFSLTSVTIGSGVTSIGNAVFYGDASLTYAMISGSVTTIGYSPFEGCGSLPKIEVSPSNAYFTSQAGVLYNKAMTALIEYPGGGPGIFIIPSSVTSINYEAFYACSGMTSVTIPGSVTYIGFGAFAACNQMSSITIPDGVTYIGDHAFEGCSSLTSVTIPGSITDIRYATFNSCSSLTSVVISNGVTTIGFVAFGACIVLNSVTIPSTVTTIAGYSFYYCTSLTSVTIPSSVTTIGGGAFIGCHSLTSITFQGLVAPTTVGGDWITDTPSEIRGHAYATSNFPILGGVWNGLIMGDYVPEDYTYTVSDGKATITGYIGTGGAITIPSTLGGYPTVAIGDWAFWLTSLTSVTMPDSITTIGDHAFQQCYYLEDVSIPDSVTSIGVGAFYSCRTMTSVTIGSGVMTIGDAAFVVCTLSLEVIHVSADNEYYASDDGVLYNKDKTILVQYPEGKNDPEGNLETAFTIPSTVKTIGNYAFESCFSLQDVTIPGSVTTIGNYAFESCFSLQDVTIPGSVTSIGVCAFNGCNSLQDVTISEGVNTIGYQAFGYCNSLTFISIPDSVEEIGDASFIGDSSLITFDVDPDNTVYASVDGVLYNKDITLLIQCPCGKTGEFSIPSSVTTIERWGFYQCTALTSVTIPNSVLSIGNWAFLHTSALTQMYFEGNAPICGESWITIHNDALVIYYYFGQTGFTTPTWYDVPCVCICLITATNLQYTGILTAQYSDQVIVSVILTTSTQTPIQGKTVTFVLGTQTTSAVTNANGVASVSLGLNQAAGTVALSATFTGDSSYQSSNVQTNFVIQKEGATVAYTGDTIVPITDSGIDLRATVFDSNDGHWGDLTKVSVTFRIYSTNNLVTPIKVIGPLTISSTSEAGIGTAVASVGVLTENNYIVIISINDNGYFSGPTSDPLTITVCDPTGTSVAGAGIVKDPSGGYGVFGFVVRYDKCGKVQGSFTYIYCENGDDFLVQSTQMTGLAFDGNHAFFEGWCTVYKYDPDTGKLTHELGKFKFRADCWDNAVTKTPDAFQLHVYDPCGVTFHQVSQTKISLGCIQITRPKK